MDAKEKIEELEHEIDMLKKELKRYEGIGKHWDEMRIIGIHTEKEIKDIDKILELKKNGISEEKIGRELNVSRQTIINRLKRYKSKEIIGGISDNKSSNFKR